MNDLKRLVRERIKDNKKMFSSKELKHVNKTFEKVYLIGLIDGKKDII